MAEEPHDHDRGLAHDLGRLMGRRRALTLIGGAGLVSLAACAAPSTTTTGATTTTPSTTSAPTTTTAGSGGTTATTAATSCAVIPEETAGPYPGDGSNGPNVLAQSGIVRRDIRSSFGSSSGTAEGVPLTTTLKVLDTANGCAAMAGAAVYLWHCDREGRYSLYSEGVTDQNYLRGVQEADADGLVTFKTIFPAAYSGRWPHIHFEVYPSLAGATASGSKTATSQLAFPADTCNLVYATDGYSQSVRNMAQTSLARDMVFSDGVSRQVPIITGSVDAGFTAQLTVPV